MSETEYSDALTELDHSRRRLIALADSLCKDQSDGPLFLEAMDACETIGRVLIALELIESELRDARKNGPQSRDVAPGRTLHTREDSDPEKGESEAQS